MDTVELDAEGCPSGLQSAPIAESDPLGRDIDLSEFVRIKDGVSTLDLIVQGAHCGGCLSKIERGIGEIDGVKSTRMNLSTMRLNTSWEGESVTPKALVNRLSDLGFGAAPYEINAAQTQSENTLKSLVKALAVSGFAAMNVMLLSVAVWSGGGEMGKIDHTMFHWISALIAVPAVLYAGRPFFRSALAALRKKQTNMDVPISLALILALSLSIYETIMGNPDTYFDAALMLLFLLLIGRYLDARLKLKTGEAAQRLAAMQVTSATRVLADGAIETVPATKIKPGDTLLIPAGQRVPVDARIIKGTSDIDTQIATGETAPVVMGAGDNLYSGTVNLTAPLTVTAIAAHADSFLAEITNLVEAGEQSKSRYVKIADRAARAYVPVVHTLSILTFVGWLFVGAELRPAALNAIAVLIITCPCALGLAVPAVQIVASGRLFKKGVLIKSGDALERLAAVDWAVFDKTGTLTKGQFSLVNKDDIAAKDLAIAAALSVHSKHPIAKALHGFTGDSPIGLSDISETAGEGLRAMMDGKSVSFGRDVKADDTDIGSVSWLKIGNRLPVKFSFEDTPRKNARESVAAVKALGIGVELLSGDKAIIAQRMGAELGFDHARGGMTPKDKQLVLSERTQAGHHTLMIGDGINDAPALASAYASASLATASDISRAAADIILQGDNLAALPYAIETARMAQKRVIENLSLAVIYNLCAIPLAVFGFVNPLIAALAMSGSSLIVMLNALRMIRK